MSKIFLSNQFILRRCFSTTSINFGSELQSAKPFEAIPVVSALTLFSRSLFPGGKYYGKSLTELHILMREEYGNIIKFPAMVGRPSIVFTYNAEDFEKVYRVEGVWPERLALDSLTYYRKEKRPDIYKEYLGLFPTHGEEWHDMRTIANPIMMQPKTVKLYCTQVDEIAKEFVELMRELRDEKGEMPADFQNHLNTWSLESVCAVALERRLNVLGGKSKDEKAQELIKAIRVFFEKSFEYDGLPSIWKYYQSPGFKKFLECYDKITDIVLHYIDQAIIDIEANKSTTSDDHEDGILRKLIKVNKKAAVVMVSDMLLAGVDTTATASTNILYCLAKNPEKQEKLREEIKKVLPEKNSKLTAEHMKNLPYLRAVIKESMRIFPVIAGTARKTQKDIVLTGHKIPANTHIFMPSFIELMNPDQYPEPKKFLPERWLRESIEGSCPHAKTANPFTYLPFGFGPRMCIGKRVADLEMEVLIANIVRNFQLEWHHPDLKIKSTFLNIPVSDLQFKIIDL